MQTYEILVKNRAVLPNSQDMTLVRTSIGIDQVHVLFDNAEWLDFPIKITFSQGGDVVTQPLTISLIDGSDEWVAEATVTVPYEVVDMTGPINVTLQGTDSDGRHIITAKGAPLSVEEAGDVVDGSMPEDAPTIDEWQQAYADAMTLMNDVQTLRDNLQSRIDQMVETMDDVLDEKAQDAVDEILDEYAKPATTESLGRVQVGNGLRITEEGVLSALSTNGVTDEEKSQIRNLAMLAYYCFDTTFDELGLLEDTAKVKMSALPLADVCDGTTITVGDDGKLKLALTIADEIGY